MNRLIFGLGNILNLQQKKAYNYHNLGALICLDIVATHNFKVSLSTEEFTLFRCNMTYVLIGHEGMNNSGHTLQKALKSVEINEIFIVHDEIDIERGRIMIKKSSNRSTHNGLRNIFATVPRSMMQVKIGIGPCDTDVCSFVLTNIKPSEKICFDEVSKFFREYLLIEKIDPRDLFVNSKVAPALVTSYKQYKKELLALEEGSV